MEHGGLNENGPHRLIGNGTIRNYVLVGVGADLSEKVHTWEWALMFQKVKPNPVSVFLFLLPYDLGLELSATSLVPCLPVNHQASLHDHNKLRL